jgi:hypothetical protein
MVEQHSHICRAASSVLLSDAVHQRAILVMRRPEIREHVEQIVMRPYVISCHFPVREHKKEDVNNVVRESPAIVRMV